MTTKTSSRSRVQRRKEARPGEILSAASKEFASKGYAATKLEDVAALAGVSKGTVYHYYKDKAVLFEAVIRDSLFNDLEQFELDSIPRDLSISDFFRQACMLAYETGKTSHIGGLVKVLIVEGDEFSELRQACLEHLIHVGSTQLREMLLVFHTEEQLQNQSYYQNPFGLIFPIICAAGLYQELHKKRGFDLDQFVVVQIEMICAHLETSLREPS